MIGVLGLTAALTGWNENRLRAVGRPHRIVHIHPLAHAGYYPGAAPLAIKLLIDARTDQILGAQAVGTEGVDKRIDVLATAMAARMRASDLLRLELAYAPQYGTAKDPVNMLGYLAENLANGTAANIQWHEVEAARAAGATIVDVRTAAEFAAEAIPGAINIPLDELRHRLGELPTERLIVHCQVGQRAHSAVCLLRAHGRDAVNLDGGLLTWRAGSRTRGEP